MGDVNGDDGVNIFDLVIVAGNFGQPLAALAMAPFPQHLSAEETVLSVMKAILTERLPTSTQLLLANSLNPFNPET